LANPSNPIFGLLFLCAREEPLYEQEVTRAMESDAFFGGFGPQEHRHLAPLKAVNGFLAFTAWRSALHRYNANALAT
jgi:hypothetical protein